jgi:hypothetical protein
MGDLQNPRTSREVLLSLRRELLSDMKVLEERVAKIDILLGEDALLLDEDSFGSPSFQMITEILGGSNCFELRLAPAKIKSVATMTEVEFKAELEKGYADYLAGKGHSTEEVLFFSATKGQLRSVHLATIYVNKCQECYNRT